MDPVDEAMQNLQRQFDKMHERFDRLFAIEEKRRAAAAREAERHSRQILLCRSQKLLKLKSKAVPILPAQTVPANEPHTPAASLPRIERGENEECEPQLLDARGACQADARSTLHYWAASKEDRRDGSTAAATTQDGDGGSRRRPTARSLPANVWKDDDSYHWKPRITSRSEVAAGVGRELGGEGVGGSRRLEWRGLEDGGCGSPPHGHHQFFESAEPQIREHSLIQSSGSVRNDLIGRRSTPPAAILGNSRQGARGQISAGLYVDGDRSAEISEEAEGQGEHV